MTHYDVIVIGIGGVGSAALYHLARRGARVLGLDRFPPGHDRGSSHGQTRIIRQAYFEHPDYVPLLVRAYELWEALAQQTGQTLCHEIGLLEVGSPEGPVITGILDAARRHGLAVEELPPGEVEARWDGFRVPDGCRAVYERRGGYLLVEDCVLAHLDAARSAGAELRTGVEVRTWQARGRGALVETDTDSYAADVLVISAGPWAGDLLTDLGVPLEVRRKPLFWFACDDQRYDARGGCPTFFFELPSGIFYGFPKIDARGVKVAEHSGGPPVADPLAVDRSLHVEDQTRLEAFLAETMPGVSTRVTDHAVCMYTMTPDEHFIVDRHPRWPQVVVAAGFSGHGFKFTSVLGEALADLALEGHTNLPIGFLSIDRFRNAGQSGERG